MVTLDGAPWFVAQDICRVLGVHIGPRSGVPNVTEMCKKLPPDETRFYRIEMNDRRGRRTAREVVVVSEKGLYTLIGRSDRPIARKLQDWLNGTVLPAIRKDHGYIAGEEKGARSVDQT